MSKTSRKKQKSPLVLLGILVILLGILFTKYPPSAQDHPTQSILSATASASAQPETNPPAPQFVGRSVNVPILYFHYIGLNPNPKDKARDSLGVSPDKFDSEMGYLSKAGYKPLDLDTLYAGLKGTATLPPKPIILSFDDGYIDFYTNAFPILQKYNFHSVSFIPVGLVGKGYYMDWSQIKTLNSTGLVSFQAHSVTHPNLLSLSDVELTSEILESKKTLEAQLGKPVNFFAYPYGTSDERVWQAVKNAGYLGAAGTWFGRTETEGAIYNMPRMRVSGSWSLEEFVSRLGL